LSGANTYTGATTVSAGTLTLGGNSAIADTGAVTVSAGATLAVSADETIGSLAGAGSVSLGVNFLTAGGDNTSTTYSGVMSGTGALTKAGTGTLTLSGSNTYTGATTVSGGTLSVAADANLGTGAVTLAATTTLAVTGATTIDNAIALTGAATVSNSAAVTLSGVISGANGLTKAGTGTLTLSGTNTYTGTTTVSAGTLSVAGDANLGTGAVTLAATTTLAVTGATTIDNAIALSGAATITNSAAVTASGVISGAGGLTKAGTGTLTLSATNTYTGATTASAGTTLVTGSIATSSGVQVSNGATLGGTGTVPAVTAVSGATLAPGTSPGVINTGALTLPAGATFSAEINGTTVGTGYDQASVTGTVNLTGSTLSTTLGFAPSAGTSFILIANDGVDAVTGTFAGLPEGATFTSGGKTFTISYVGGTGNDVVVSVAPPTVSIGNVTAAEGNSGSTAFTFTVTLSAVSAQTVTVNYATANGTAQTGSDYTSASGTLTFAPGETSKTITVAVTGDTTVEPDETFTVVLSGASNATIATGTGTGTITNDDKTSPAVVSIGTGGGTPGTVRPVDPVTGAPGTPITAFAGFGGEIRVASGDVNGDGLADTITGAGAGAAGGHVKVFAADGTLLYSFLAFSGFSGGVFVATGDVNGDGREDIVVAADAGAAPHVKVFSGKDGSLLQSFLAYDAGFRGGVRVSTGDVNGDGFDDIITGSGPGSAPHVKAFSGKDGSLLRSFLAYDAGFGGGVYVAAGDVNGDGRDDIVTGTGPGTRAHVKVFSASDGSLLQSFFAYDAGFRGGVRVGTGVVNGQTAVLTGAGPGAGPHVKAFVNGLEVSSLFAGSTSFTGGVYVG
ncbi:autotransporter-associated beta strand repeat-containing protein, partial [Gemmata sp. JC717]|uniref:beta strand repeat-containing protein n=1 Tax=Gemmata algarum TaxID=2975278 RepID=UPI0021BB47D9